MVSSICGRPSKGSGSTVGVGLDSEVNGLEQLLLSSFILTYLGLSVSEVIPHYRMSSFLSPSLS